MKPHPPRRRPSGVALVLVLAFVVLLTGLVIAFFARSVNDRDLSNSSAEQTQAALFAQASLTQVVGDLKEEIAGRSNPTVAYAYLDNVYLPATPMAVVPCPSGLVGGAPALPPNVVKRSAYNQAFYSITEPASYGFGTSPYVNSSKYPPSNRAVNVPSSKPSANGRFVSLERWNKPMLIPTTSDASQAPATTGTFSAGANSISWSYDAPDWVLVDRTGANPKPTALDATLTWTPNTGTTVIGRYAYTIYDEGGLLDMNVAGYPVDATGAPAAFASPSDVSRKSLLAHADLSQLHTAGKLGMSTTQIGPTGGFVGWRNAATVAACASPVTYTTQLLFNPAGFLRTNNPGGSATNDQVFVGRQALLDFIQTKFPNDSTLHDAIQYMGTFSRDLNSPSLWPVHTPSPVTAYYPGLPTLQGTTSGGNDQLQANYDTINPAFSNARVGAFPTFTQPNEGTVFIQKETLIKKRFPLSRLAWLTYVGPITLDGTSYNPKLPSDYVARLQAYGFTDNYLKQGTPSNITACFGLTWNTNGYWTLAHLVGGASIGTLAQAGGGGTSGGSHEPDFLELLKASITAGALGKGGNPGTSTTPPYPVYLQNLRDQSVDSQVIQIAANIIDQFDLDGYPTRIRLSATGNKEWRGIESLPYLYRVRNAAWRIADATPTAGTVDVTAQKQTTKTFANTANQGVEVFMQEPEVWNPHGYDPTSAATIQSSLGSPAPSQLGICVYSGLPTPNYLNQGVSGVAFVVRPWVYTGNAAATLLDGRESGPAIIASRTLNSASPMLTFTNSSTASPTDFREPTLLVKPNLFGLQPGAGLTALAGTAADNIPSYSTTKGFLVKGKPTAYGATEAGAASDAGYYLGVYLGKGYAAWQSASDTTGTSFSTPAHTNVTAGLRIDGSGSTDATFNTTPVGLTYQMVYIDPNTGGYSTYDEKYFAVERYTSPIDKTLMNDANAATGGDYAGQMLGGNRFMTGFDPRTSRFGFQTSNLNDSTDPAASYDFPPGRPGTAQQWVTLLANVLPSNRPDSSAGYGASPVPTGDMVASAPPNASLGWKWDGILLRYGLFSINSMDYLSDRKRFAGDGAVTNTTTAAQYYSDPDGVVRRAGGGYVAAANSNVGLPMTTAFPGTDTRQRESRPILLNHPFRSVGDLECAFSDTPWKNLDFSTPESGYAGLLDVFCLAESDHPDGLVAGRVNLNTRQIPVLQAILAGAYRDEYNSANAKPLTPGDNGEAAKIAAALVQRTFPGGTTISGQPSGQLANVSELVGRFVNPKNTALTLPIKGSDYYDGFSADFITPSADPNASNDAYETNIARYRSSSIRALANVGTTRTWNLMIDLVAQTGRYPVGAATPDKFIVDSEQRCWLHIAIDRMTGKVIDQQLEIVKE